MFYVHSSAVYIALGNLVDKCDSTNMAAAIILPITILCNLFSFLVYYTHLYTGFYYFNTLPGASHLTQWNQLASVLTLEAK